MSPPPVRTNLSRLFLRLGDRNWTQRRVEELSVIGRRLVLRKVTVVVKVPKRDADATVGDRKIAYLPLNWYEKRSGTQERVFQVVDEQQLVVAALVPEEREKQVVRALMTAVDRLFPCEPSQQRADLIEQLKSAVRADDPACVRAHVRKFHRRLADLQPSNLARAELRKRRRALVTVVGTVTRHRLLLVPVPADNRPHWFSFEYASSQQFERLRDGSGLRRLARRMGWRPMIWEFGVPGAALTPLVHVVFRAPDGVAIRSAELVVGRDRDTGQGADTLYQIDHRSSLEPSRDARATVHLEPFRSGLLTNGLVASSIISALLLAGDARHDLLAGVAEKADAAAALLLAAPSFFLLHAVQSFEHQLVSSMLKGLRWTLLAVGLAAFLAALLLVVATSDPPPRDLWWLLTTIAVLGTASLVVTFLFGTGVSRRSKPPPQPRSTGDGSGAACRRTRQGISGALILLCLIAGGAAVLWAFGFGGTEPGGRIRLPLRVDLPLPGPSLAILLSTGILLAALALWPAPRPASDPNRRGGVPPACGPDDELFRAAFRDVVEAASPRPPTA